MSTANTAGPPSVRGAAAGRGDAPPAGPDWKWQVGKMVLFYVAFQGVTGPNGLIAWYQGKASFQKQGVALNPSAVKPPTSGQQSTGSSSSSPAQNPFSVPAGPVSKVPSNSSTVALFDYKSAVDFYVFITTQDAPSMDDLTTQFSTLVPGSKGPRSAKEINFDDKELASLLQDPIRDSFNEAKIWTSSKDSDKILAGVKWSNVPLNDYSLSQSADLSVNIPKEVQSTNASLWAEIYATPTGMSPTNKKTTVRMRKCECKIGQRYWSRPD